MDALQTIVDFFSSMGTALVAAIFIVIALILIWLIVRASRRGPDSKESAVKPAQPGRYHAEPETQQTGSAAPSQVAAAETGAAASEPISENVVMQEPREPEAHAPAKRDAIVPEPEDSVLHRHYEAELAAKKAALANPYPTDSVLRRHYDTLHTLHLQDAPAAVKVAAKPPAEKAEAKIDTRKSSTIEQAVKKDTQVAGRPAAVSRPENKAADMRVPEDSVLKRHFISQLQAEVRAGMPPRPTDSVLRRHYDGMLNAALEKRLRG